MKKEVIGIIILLFMVSIAVAEENASSDASVDKAYSCLTNLVSNSNALSLKDAILGTLALGANDKLKSEIDSEKGSGGCWPKAGCKITDTAQALIAYDRIGRSTNEIKDWLLTKSISAKELAWYVEVDIADHTASDCTVKYDSRENKIKINEDMKITGNPGSCFEIGYNGYWLKVRDSCLGKDFEISCDKDFITALAYQKRAGGSVFISSETHAGSSGGWTQERVESQCFGTSGRCDYEGTLWAALALNKMRINVKSYTPYLLAFSEDNQKYLPSAFLYILNGGDDSYDELVEKQKSGKYWEIVGSPYNRFYDSALGLLSLNGRAESDAIKDYFLSVQTKEGCWNNNNIRDTGFILYAGWPKGNVVTEDDKTPLCESSGLYCQPSFSCIEAGGQIKEGYKCGSFRDSCCTIRVNEPSCSSRGGLICASDEECKDGAEVPSLEGSCCLSKACIKVEPLPQNICESSAGGTCASSCIEGEEETSDSCTDRSEVCCVPVEETGSWWTYVIILVILIALVILGIVYRQKLQVWWHSRKQKDGGQPRGPPRGPPRSPPRFGLVVPQNRFLGRAAPPRSIKSRSPEEKEMEETMRKLKEMSK